MDIIAELGSNWDDLDGILATVKQVSSLGASGLKLQVFRADRFYSAERAPKIYQTLKDFEIPYEWLPVVHESCHKFGMTFWISTFDEESLWRSAPHCDGLKIASGDITNTLLIEGVADIAEKYALPLAFSGGAATDQEIFSALDLINTHRPKEVIYLHCVSDYPALASDYKIAWLMSIRDHVDRIGLSDHALLSIPAVLSIAIGGSYFEKHYKPSFIKRKTPDMKHSLSDMAFATYVFDLMEAKNTFYGQRNLTPGEIKERLWARRGSDGLRPTDSVHE